MADQPRERAILVGLDWTGRKGGAAVASAEESLEELTALAESAGAEVLEAILQTRPAPDAATLIGSGKVNELAALAKGTRAALVIFDHELSGVQQRNLEKKFDCKVIDRTQLILDIFARRARTREGQLQVELAQLNYLLPRLTGRGVTLSRLGGGIGTRGPGETQLETDRRRISRRLRKIERDLDSVRTSRGIQRRQRQGVPLLTLALVGYTNAGKSTFFNRLTGAGVLADARLFATLDPTVRALSLPSRRRVLLSDTVGFIRQLPTTLVRAFRATLEEVAEAALLIHLVDASSPLSGHHCAQVQEVLAEIGAGETPQLLVLNKADLLSPDPQARRAVAERLSAQAGGVQAVFASSLTGEGLEEVLSALDRLLPNDPVRRAVFRFPLADLAPLHWLHEGAVVIGTRYSGDVCEVEAEVPESLLRRLEAFRPSVTL